MSNIVNNEDVFAQFNHSSFNAPVTFIVNDKERGAWLTSPHSSSTKDAIDTRESIHSTLESSVSPTEDDIDTSAHLLDRMYMLIRKLDGLPY